jgi:hypothetical protein
MSPSPIHSLLQEIWQVQPLTRIIVNAILNNLSLILFSHQHIRFLLTHFIGHGTHNYFLPRVWNLIWFHFSLFVLWNSLPIQVHILKI